LLQQHWINIINNIADDKKSHPIIIVIDKSKDGCFNEKNTNNKMKFFKHESLIEKFF
jgi:hypothetical protein